MHQPRSPLAVRLGGPAAAGLLAAFLATAAQARPAQRAAPGPAAASAAAALPAPAASDAAGAARFTFYGLTNASAGQPLAQAEARLGQALKAEPQAPALAGASNGCHYRSHAARPGVRFAVAGDVITRIETRDARYATVSGLRVGDSVERAQRLYGKRLKATAHPYFDKGRVLTVLSPDKRFALVMESNDAGRIITLRGGRLPDVTWLEGCA